MSNKSLERGSDSVGASGAPGSGTGAADLRPLSMAEGETNFDARWSGGDPYGAPVRRSAEFAMTLKQLSYFLSVAELGSLSKAAVLMSVAQPVISRQIKRLEAELGVELFYRNGRGTVLSEAGKRLVVHARAAMDSLEDARSEINAIRSAPQGVVAIAMPPSIGWVLSTALARRCRAEYPDIHLHVMEGFSGHVAEWLTTGRIDIGIVYGAPRRSNLQAEPLFSDELVLLGPASDPADVGSGAVEAARMSEIPLILPARPHGLRVIVDEVLAKLGVTAKIELEVDAMTATLSLVEQGAGYTILSETAAQHLLGAGRIRSWPIVEPAIPRQLMLATSTQRPMSVATRIVSRMIREQAKSSFPLPSESRARPVAAPAK
jgi:LysR family nitrogen assimilation transcriptional regulator